MSKNIKVGDIVEETTRLVEMPRIKDLVKFQSGFIEFDLDRLDNWIESFRLIYSKYSMDEKTKEVTLLLEQGNIEAIHEKLKVAKANPAKLRNLSKELAGELKNIKKLWNEPISEFETNIKKFISEIDFIANSSAEIEVNPLNETIRNHKFDTFSKPILQEVRVEIQNKFPKIDCSVYQFADNSIYYNLTSKKQDIYYIAISEFNLWATSKNEIILNEEKKAQDNIILHQDLKLWEDIFLKDYNIINKTKWGISDIHQEITLRVSKEEIFNILDVKTKKIKEDQIPVSKDVILQKAIIFRGSYNLSFNSIEDQKAFEIFLEKHKHNITWNKGDIK